MFREPFAEPNPDTIKMRLIRQIGGYLMQLALDT